MNKNPLLESGFSHIFINIAAEKQPWVFQSQNLIQVVYGPNDLDLSVVVDLCFSVVVRTVNPNIWEEDRL